MRPWTSPYYWCPCSATQGHHQFPEAVELALTHFYWHMNAMRDIPRIVVFDKPDSHGLVLEDHEQAARIAAQLAEMKRVPTDAERFALAREQLQQSLAEECRKRGISWNLTSR